MGKGRSVQGQLRMGIKVTGTVGDGVKCSSPRSPLFTTSNQMDAIYLIMKMLWLLYCKVHKDSAWIQYRKFAAVQDAAIAEGLIHCTDTKYAKNLVTQRTRQLHNSPAKGCNDRSAPTVIQVTFVILQFAAHSTVNTFKKHLDSLDR
jgi:hypothetical protein